MLNALGQLVGWIGAHALEAMGVFFGAVVIATLSVWVDRALTGRVETKTETEVVEVPSVFDPQDLLTGTTPKTRTEYEAPDSSDTRTDCVRLPTWLDTISRDTSVSRSHQKKPRKPSKKPSVRRDRSVIASGLPYVITPTTSGSPTLSVGPRRVVLQSLSPRDGSALTYEYDVPRPDWKITAGGGLTAGSGFALGMSTAGLSHRTPVGWLSLEAGYGGVVTDRVRSGALGRVSLRKTLYSW